MNIFDLLYEPYKINKPIRLIELFAGYGSQSLALEYLNANFQHHFVCEFDKYAIQTYNEIHDTSFKPSDITKINAKDLNIIETDQFTYLLTYSFPCQDLSMAGNRKGMNKGSGTRSGLLWEVERLLTECKELNGNLPNILLMENVPQVITANGWREWNLFLESLGYKNYCEILNAKEIGYIEPIPQNRERAFMISILGDYSYSFPQKQKLKLTLEDILEQNVDEKYYLSEKKIESISHWKAQQDPLKDIDKEKLVAPTLTARGAGLEHSGMVLINEATLKGYSKTKNKDMTIKTKLCNKLIRENKIKEYDVIRHSYTNSRLDGEKKDISQNNISPTLDTRCDCLGVSVPDDASNLRIRKLTPKECFRLMGVRDKEIDKISCSDAQKYKQAGNSIVVNVLMAIFKQLL